MAAHQAPPSLGFSRQEHWSGLPFPSPMHESEKWKVKAKSLSRVWPSATLWTAAFQAPPSMGFARQEYWSGVPLPSLKGTSTLTQNNNNNKSKATKAKPFNSMLNIFFTIELIQLHSTPKGDTTATWELSTDPGRTYWPIISHSFIYNLMDRTWNRTLTVKWQTAAVTVCSLPHHPPWPLCPSLPSKYRTPILTLRCDLRPQ